MAISPALAKKIADASPTGGGNVITDGDYVFVIKELLIKEGFKGNSFIAKFDVVMAEKKHPTVLPNPVGTDCYMALNLDTNKMAAGNMKQFFTALWNEELSGTPYVTKVDEWTKPAAEGGKQPARGMLIEAATYRKLTQTGPNTGKEGCYPNFIHVSAESDESGLDNSAARVKARRTELDANGR